MKALVHHDETGNSLRMFIKYLFSRPEIIPPATCSSATGLVINNIMESPPSTPASANHEETPRSDSEGPFVRKRKYKLSAAEERHREKLARQDKFLEYFRNLLIIEYNIIY